MTSLGGCGGRAWEQCHCRGSAQEIQPSCPHGKVSPAALSSSSYSGQFDKMKSPFEWDIVTRGLVAMTIEGFVGFFITIMCQYNFFRKPQ